MSKIGKKPIEIKSGITTSLQGSTVKISGPKGQLEYQIPSVLELVVEQGKISVRPKEKTQDKNFSAIFGLTRANLANMVLGVEKGFEKKLELSGVGYKANMQGIDLVLSLGFSHPVKFKPKTGIKISVVDNVVVISGIDKMLVGETAAKIRGIKPPEPYKGKGIKYVGEYIRRKQGKVAKAVGAK
jgi:large subunit ribosomal protein L6